jgi:mannose-6-phosphate isomerase-like protein (cupin superfamily)
MRGVVSLRTAANDLSDYWSPRVVGTVDDSYVRVAKLKGSLTWHTHAGEDELFLVLKGQIQPNLEPAAVD